MFDQARIIVTINTKLFLILIYERYIMFCFLFELLPKNDDIYTFMERFLS